MFAQVKSMDKGDGLNSVITLTDEAIEYTAPVDILLRTIYRRELPLLTSFTRADYRAAVRILQKYNCSAAMQMLRYSLYAFAEAPGHCKVGIFTIASYLDEVRVCSNMLLAGVRHQWWERDQFGRPFSEQLDITERPIKCKSLFDLASLPRSMAQDIPWEYNFALTRAQTIHRGGDLHRADWEAFVKDFEAHLKIGELWRSSLLSQTVNPSVRGKSMAGDS